MLVSFSIMVATLVSGIGIDVRSATDCPSSEAILARLRPLLPGGSDVDDVAWVEVVPPERDDRSALHLRLVRSDASVVADRRLARQGGCDEMADTVATVLATWETPQVSQTPAPIEVASPESPPVETTKAPRTDVWLGAGGGAGFLGGIAATGMLELLAGRAGSHVQARAAGMGQTSRQRGLEPGQVIWRRSYASLGLGWQTLGASSGSFWRASADAGLLLGWLTASGSGFAPNQRSDAFEYGAGLGLRGHRKMGAWALWLECRTSIWAQRQRAVLSSSPSSPTAELPRFDVLVTLGVGRLVLR
jgi:hypothetical protein